MLLVQIHGPGAHVVDDDDRPGLLPPACARPVMKNVVAMRRTWKPLLPMARLSEPPPAGYWTSDPGMPSIWS